MSNKKIFVVVVCGPTASGKTDLGVKLAQRLDGEILSADSMQIYKGMNIASAKPTEEAKSGIPHHMMDFLEPDKAYSVADYVETAHRCIGEIHARHKLPLIVGGTGLYISSLVNNLKFDDTGCDNAFRAKMKKFAEENGNEALWEKLRQVDPKTAERLHPNNLNRVIRALEVFYISGNTISEAQEKSREEESPYKAYFLMSDYPREELYARIDSRVDKMLDMGLEEEAREFFTHSNYVTSSQAIGYKELKPFIDGEKTLEECVLKLKQATRNYAKRQLTWFGKLERLHRIKVSGSVSNETVSRIADEISELRDRFYEEK